MKIQSLSFQKVKEFVLDLLFPRFCVGCQKEGVWICWECKKKIELVRVPTCPICQRLAPKGFCPSHKRSLTGIIIAAKYTQPLVEAIHTFKYEGIKELAKDLAWLLIHSLNERKITKKAILIPMPLYWQRKNIRGFNQAELLSTEISKNTGMKILKNSLVRIKNTRPQVGLRLKERKENVQNAFGWKGPLITQSTTVILVDDVITSGETLNEAAKIVRQAGAGEVWGLVLAKG